MNVLPNPGYVKMTGRMRRAIMTEMGLVRTKRNGQWKLIPVPVHKNRQSLYTQQMELAMTLTGYKPETIALWEPLSELADIYSFDIGTWQYDWGVILKLEWEPDRLPSCIGCEYSTFKCTTRPPDFQCRVLTMAQRTVLRPNVYWKRVIDLGT